MNWVYSASPSGASPIYILEDRTFSPWGNTLGISFPGLLQEEEL